MPVRKRKPVRERMDMVHSETTATTVNEDGELNMDEEVVTRELAAKTALPMSAAPKDSRYYSDAQQYTSGNTR
jgi:hypothetical protein